jgi:membrane protease YdiL (CAAX protease family)
MVASAMVGDAVSMTGPQLMPVMVSFQFFLLALGLLLARLVGIAPINDCHWNFGGISMGLVAGIALAAVAIRVSALPWLRDLERLIDQEVVPIFQGLPWQSLIAIAALAGASEEVLFRGFLQHWLAEGCGLGSVLAIVVAALLFGAVHALSVAYFVFAFVLGAVFGWIFVATDNLAVAIIMHAAYDAVVLLMLSQQPEDVAD